MIEKKSLNILLLLALGLSISGCGVTKKIKDKFHKDDDTPHDPVVAPAKKINFNQEATFTASNQPFVQGTNFRPVKAQSADNGGNFQKVSPLSSREKSKIQTALERTNNLRADKGLPPLKYDEDLGAYAAVRARELKKKFSHTRPDGRHFSSGLNSRYYAGENIATGTILGAKDVIKLWRDSPGHYRNMMGDYERIGIGHYSTASGDYWVQVFSSHDTNSLYRFDQSATPDENPAMESFLAGQISTQNGKINLGNAPTTENQSARAYQAGELSHGIYKTARLYNRGDYQAIIQDPTGVFAYQTFGEVVNANGFPVQFVNIGQPSVPNQDSTFTAHYSGVSLGAVDGTAHVYANVEADVNFGTKTADVAFSNSRQASLKGSQLSSNRDLNFNERLHWRGDHFRGSTTRAQFYGPNGEEMGGSFSRQTPVGIYEGVFGLQKN